MRTIANTATAGNLDSVVDDEFSMPADLEKAGWLAQIWHLFAHDRLVNLLFIFAIIVGFFQGWLKYKFRTPWVTFAFDIPLTLAWILCVLSVRRGRALFPDCNMSRVLKVLTGFGIAYVLLPFGVPWLIALASFRAWCFIPLIFLLGYHTTRSVRQMEVHLWLLMVLGVTCAFYALFQTTEEVMEMMKNDPEMTFRLQNQFYSDSQGRGVFRRFSTFVSSAAFGGMMAYCATFGISRLVHPGCSTFERLFLVGASALMAYGVVLSGSRSTLGGLVAGLGFAIWYRRDSALARYSPAFIVAGLAAALYWQGSGVIERFGSVLDLETLWNRLYIVFAPSLISLSEHPLGDGLGRAGHGVPVIFANLYDDYKMRPIDGDLGRMVVDMGIFGIGLTIAITLVGMTDAFSWMRKLRGSPLGLIGLPAGSMFVMVAPAMIYGSPFLGIPGGMLSWFFLGSMRRLVEDYEKYVSVAGKEAADVADEFVSFITSNRLMPLYKQDRTQRGPSNRIRGLTERKAAAPVVGVPQAAPQAAQVASAGRIRSGGSAKWTPPATQGSTTTNPLSGNQPTKVAKRFLFRRPADSPDRRRPRR